jgi:hypothetical protein
MLLSLGLSKYTNCAAYFISHSKTLVTNIKIFKKDSKDYFEDQIFMTDNKDNTMTILSVHPQNVRFQNVRFQNVWFQNVRFQNVRFTKPQVYKTSGFKSSAWFQNVQFLNLIYLLNKKYRNCQVCIPI